MKSKRAVLVLQSILLGAFTPVVLAKGEMKPPGAGSLSVDVQPPKTLPSAHYQSRDCSCHYKITNVSKKPIEFALYSCSVWDNWATDSKEVVVKTGGCRANVLADHALQPNDSLEGEVDVNISASDRTGIRPFHLILTPYSTNHEQPMPVNHFLSNLIHLNLETDRRH